MIYYINFADSNFKFNRRINSISARCFGKADVLIEYSPKDIDEDFISQHQNIFKYQRGYGLWLWKPYIILKTLAIMKEDDYLIYCDAGSIIINNLQLLVSQLESRKRSIMLFELPLIARQFTKRETFQKLNFTDVSTNQILGGYIVLKNNKQSRSFISEWLAKMSDEQLLSPKIFDTSITNFQDYISHREDQSILTILARQYNLEVFRDPSDYGVHPWEFMAINRIYSPKTYDNSPYPVVLLSNRSSNPFLYMLKYFIKRILFHLGLYNAEYYYKKIHN